MTDRRVVFEITAHAKLDIFEPVMRSLQEHHGIRSRLLVSSEVHNQRTQRTRVMALDPDYVQTMPLPIGSKRADWSLFNRWLKRNAGRILTDMNAGVLVEPSDRTYPHHFFIDAAKRLGIPSVLVQESLRKDESMRLTPAQWLRRTFDLYALGVDSRLKKYGQGNCDRITAWGEFSREYYRRVGVDDAKVVVTGNPAFDVIDSKDWSRDAAALEERLGVGRDETVVALLASPLAGIGVLTQRQQDDLTAAAFAGFRAYASEGGARPRLVVKPHHLESADYYRGMIDAHGLQKSASVVMDAPLYPLIARANVVAIFSTTAGVEAALFRKPLAVMDGGHTLDNWDLAGRGVGERIRDAAEFTAFLRRAADPAARRALGERGRQAAEAFATDIGSSARNVARLIAELLARPARPPS